MRRFATVLAVLAGVASAAPSLAAREPERVVMPWGSVGPPLTGHLFRPEGDGPFAAIVALHGCSGYLTRSGSIRSREADWAARLAAAGYAVLLPDSFGSRGLAEICTSRERALTPQDRAGDALAAAAWLGRQPFVDGKRLALMGWSHGAMAVLWTVGAGVAAPPLPFKTAVAFYPGCRQIARQAGWLAAVPLTVLMGAADDWTEPGPCRELAQRAGFRFIEYPGAVHGFDAPNSPLRLRSGLGRVKGGKAHVGTDPAARAAAIEEVMRLLQAALHAR